MSKFILFFIILFFATTNFFAQNANDYFNQSAEFYLKNQSKIALSHLEKGLEKYPSSQKLKALKKLLEQRNKKQKKEDEKENSSKQENKPDQKNEMESQKQNGENKGEKGSGSNNEQLNQDKNKPQRNNNGEFGTEKSNYNQILKALQKQEKSIQRRLLRNKTRAEAKRNEKDW